MLRLSSDAVGRATGKRLVVEQYDASVPGPPLDLQTEIEVAEDSTGVLTVYVRTHDDELPPIQVRFVR